jgi:hypothetical protein
VKSVQQATQNYTGSAGRAATDWQQGIQNTQKDQAQLAVAAIPRMVAGFNDAAASGRIASGLTRGGTAYWKQRSLLKASNYQAGITQGQDNYAAAAAKFMPAIQNGVNSLPARGDINQNLQRSAALALYLHGLKGSLGAR